MSYRIGRDEEVLCGVRRVVREEAAGAVAALEGADDDPDAAIHDARKRFKKIRAAFRLVRPLLPSGVYGGANRYWRDTGRLLAPAREAAAGLEALDRLHDTFSGRVEEGAMGALRTGLVEEHDRAVVAALAGPGPVSRALQRARDGPTLDDHALHPTGLAGALPGLEKTYRRGRCRMAAAYRSPGFEAFHEWRKRAKDLWYHARLLERGEAAVLAGLTKDLHALTDLLGRANDYADLVRRTTESAVLLPDAAPRRAFVAVCTDRCGGLWQAAGPLGALLYRAPPARFTAAFERLWRAAA